VKNAINRSLLFSNFTDMKSRFFIFSLLTMLTVGWACDKKTVTPTPEPNPEPKSAALNLVFVNKIGDRLLELDKGYLLSTGDSLTVNKLNYYISNIVLTATNGATYKVPESYFIVKQSSATSQTISLQVPFDTYTAINFMLGVDSARNVSGAQTGGLDPVYASDMYWSWSTGYIFFKLEGNSPQSGSPQKAVEYHIGGYKGTFKTQRNFNLDFLGQKAVVSVSGNTPKIFITANINEVFQNPSKINLLSDYNIVSAGSRAKMLADNYSDFFTFKEIVP